MSETTLNLRITENSAAAVRGLENLANALSRVRNAVNSAMNFGNIADGIGRLMQSLSNSVPEDSVARIERVANAMERMRGIGTINVRVAAGSDAPIRNIQDSMTGAADSARNVRAATDEVGNAVANVAPRTTAAATGIRGFINSLSELNIAGRLAQTGIGRLITQFARIARMRMMRWVIKELVKDIKEGLDNFKQYSKAIGGDYYKNVTSLSDATLKMKNAIGAALAPAIQLVLPYVQQLVSWFINLVNIVNQFLALLNGQTTWSQAVDVSSEAFEESKHHANNAHKAIKELLADFDELNIIQSESGNDSGKQLYDYTQMFQESSVFDSKIKSIVNWLKEHLTLVKDVAIAIGAAILGWRLASLFTHDLSTLLGVFLIIAGVVTSIKAGIDQWNNGIDLTNMIQMISGLSAVVIGCFIAFGLTGGAIALIVAGFAALITPMKELAETGTLTDEAFTQLAIGIGAIFTGIAILSHSWIPILIAALVTLAVWIYTHWDEIKEWFYTVVVPILLDIAQWIQNNLVQPIITAWNWCKETLSAIWQGIVSTFNYVWENGFHPMVNGINTMIIQPIIRFFQDMGTVLKTGWDTITDWWNQLWNNEILPVALWINEAIIAPIVSFFSALWGSIIGDGDNNLGTWWNKFWMNNIMPMVTTIYTDIILPIEEYFATLWAGIITAWDLVTGWWNDFWNGLLVWVGNVYISIVTPIENTLTGAWYGIQAAWNLVADWWDEFWVGLTKWVAGAYTDIIQPIVNYFVGAWDSVVAVWNSIVVWWNGFWEGSILPIVSWIDTYIIQPIVGFFAGLWGTITGDPNSNLSTWWDGIWKNQVAPVVDWINEYIIGPIAGFFSGLWGTITGDPNNNLSSWWSEIWEDKIGGLVGFIHNDIINPITTFFSALWGTITGDPNNNLSEWWSDLWENGIGGMVTWINDHIVEPVTGYFSSLWTTIKNSTIVSGIQSWWDSTLKLFKGPTEWVKTNIIDKVTGFFSGLWKSITTDVGIDDTWVVFEWLFGENGVMSGIANGVKTFITEKVYGFFNDMWKKITGDEDNDLATWWEGIFGEDGTLVGVAKKVGDFITNVVFGFFHGLWGSITGDETNTLASWWEGLFGEKGSLRSVVDKIDENILQPIKDFFTNLWSWFTEDFWKGMVLGGIDTAVKNIREKFVNPIIGFLDQVKGVVKSVIDFFSGGGEDTLENADYAGWARTQAYQDMAKYDTNEDHMTKIRMAMGYEIDQNNGQPIELGSDLSRAVINSMIQAFSSDSAFENGIYTDIVYILKALNDSNGYGWDLQQIIDMIDLSSLDEDQMESLREAIEQLNEEYSELDLNLHMPELDAGDLESSMSESAANVREYADSIRASVKSLDGLAVRFAANGSGVLGGTFHAVLPAANGGMFDSGQMFLAGEAGPEVIGRIGNRSAVVNQPQMVDAISGGVAEGMGKANESTDALLGQAVALLGRILQKTGTQQPSAAHGRVVKQSLEMYAKAGG